ncbi:Propionyl-CoA:succinate CoA transferase [Aquisphaera giovannonii]|uniref:Propionyl-CoA:succinate CoA transferase n=1 Tax=Aquisphaera giovannonii TaxID=406548 RepID=A0A5B9W2A1_9BACT|nr:succinate CoA transferase [Aquisphaera giovannonii]QEH34703.1 Propionyl-CoA:succinate CoA transferase [Aquisphaera giovannonii]
MSTGSPYPTLTAEEAAALIPHGAMVGVSGFTPAGSPKAVPTALAARASSLHKAGQPFQIKLLSGASTGKACDDELALAEALSWRAPYMTSAPIRKLANTGRIDFVDMHLSHVPQMIMEGFLGEIDYAIIEATDITPDGRVYLTTGIGNSPAILKKAHKVIIELNAYHSPRLREMADIIVLPPPPNRIAIQIHDPLDRVGRRYAEVDPARVVGVVHTNQSDGGRAFSQPDNTSGRIAANVSKFLLGEMAAGRLPSSFLPLQSGVGNVCNAVLGGIAAIDEFPQFKVYTEVLQDSMIDLIAAGRVIGASTCSLSLTDEKLKFLYDEFDEFADRIILRPQEISNNPGIARRLGVIATNTAIEVDIYGHANSTHFFGTQIMNGLGGSGDFERNAYLSILMCPSTAKGGKISTIVPMCSHVDHNEHSVQVIVTEQGLADLRGLSPIARARTIIDNCAHPAYRDYLHHYLESSPMGHLRHDLRRCFELYLNFQEQGAMLPDLDLSQFEGD